MKKKPILNTCVCLTLLFSLSSTAMTQQGKPRVPTLTTEDVLSRRSSGTVVAPSPSAPAPKTRTAPPARGAIEWRRDIRTALEEASSNHKVVVVDVYTDWCGWCHKMDDNIYSSPQIAALSKDVVFLKLDAEDGAEGQQFAKQTKVTGYPTTFVLDGEGTVIDTAKGYIGSPPAFISFVNRARDKR